jgi:hypothetical protein
VRYFAWHPQCYQVFDWSTQLDKGLCVQQIVMKIVVMVDGAPKGPFDLDALKQVIEQGAIESSALARLEDQDKWIELRHIPELQEALATAPDDAEASGVGKTKAGEASLVTEGNSRDAARLNWYYRDKKKTLGPTTIGGIKDPTPTMTLSGA